jgi:hypothetical protein
VHASKDETEKVGSRGERQGCWMTTFSRPA